MPITRAEHPLLLDVCGCALICVRAVPQRDCVAEAADLQKQLGALPTVPGANVAVPMAGPTAGNCEEEIKELQAQIVARRHELMQEALERAGAIPRPTSESADPPR